MKCLVDDARVRLRAIKILTYYLPTLLIILVDLPNLQRLKISRGLPMCFKVGTGEGQNLLDKLKT